SRGSVKVRKNGALALPTLRAMEKAVPLADDSEFVLPDLHELYCELLQSLGVLRVQGNEVVADPGAATRQFARPGFQQMNSWARGWLSARHWLDGTGAPEGRWEEDSAERVRTGRQVLAWALGCLANAGDHWYELDTFLAQLQALQGHSSFHLPYGTPA